MVTLLLWGPDGLLFLLEQEIWRYLAVRLWVHRLSLAYAQGMFTLLFSLRFLACHFSVKDLCRSIFKNCYQKNWNLIQILTYCGLHCVTFQRWSFPFWFSQYGITVMIYIKFKKASYDSFPLFTILYLVCAICSNSIFFFLWNHVSRNHLERLLWKRQGLRGVGLKSKRCHDNLFRVSQETWVAMGTASVRSELVTSAGRGVCHFNLLVTPQKLISHMH